MSSSKLLLAIFAIALCGCGCSPQFDGHAAVKSGYSKIPQCPEIDELLGEADHYVGGNDRKLEWCTDIRFGGQYELRMRAPVEVNRLTWEVTNIGEVKFFLFEVKSVTMRTDGTVLGVDYEPKGQWEFDGAAWEKVVKANGDFSAIGIKLKSGEIPNFDKYDAQLPHRRFGP